MTRNDLLFSLEGIVKALRAGINTEVGWEAVEDELRKCAAGASNNAVMLRHLVRVESEANNLREEIKRIG